MNNLSILIYLAEVVGNLRGVLIAVAVISGGGAGIVALICALAEDTTYPQPEIKGLWKSHLRWLWLTGFAAMLAAFTPSAPTIYMIAASEAGETIVQTPDAIEMMGDLKAIIKKRLKEELAGE